MNRFFPFFILIFILGCDTDSIYEEVRNIENNEWTASDSLSFTIDVTDTTTGYNIYYDVRYSDEYPFYNLYVTQTILDTAGNELASDLHEIILFDRKTGQPLGSGYGNTVDHRILARRNYKFPHSQNYTIKVEHQMRKDTLSGISGFGIAVKEYIPEKGTEE